MLYVLDVDGDKNCTVAPGVKDTHTTSINFNNMMCIFVSSFAFLISSAFPPHFLFPPMHYLSTSRYVAICGHGNAHRYIIVNQSVQTLGVRSITGYSGISFILDSFDVGVRYRFMHRRTAILYHTQGNGANELWHTIAYQLQPNNTRNISMLCTRHNRQNERKEKKRKQRNVCAQGAERDVCITD